MPPTFWFAEFLYDVLAAPPQPAFHWSVLTTGQTIRLSHWSASGEPWRQGLTMQNVLLRTVGIGCYSANWRAFRKQKSYNKLIYLFETVEGNVFREKPELDSELHIVRDPLFWVITTQKCRLLCITKSGVRKFYGWIQNDR